LWIRAPSSVIYGVERVNVKFAMPRRQPRRRSQWRRDVIPQCHGLWCRARGLFFKIFPKNTLVRIFQKKRAKKLKKRLFCSQTDGGPEKTGRAWPHAHMGKETRRKGKPAKQWERPLVFDGGALSPADFQRSALVGSAAAAMPTVGYVGGQPRYV
jgi:hypothetical protein